MDPAVFLSRAGVAPHPVGVKHQNQLAGMKALIVAQHVHQRLPGILQAHPGHLLQIRPGKNDVVSVHQQHFLARVRYAHRAAVHRRTLRRRVRLPGPYRAVGSFENRPQQLILLRGAPIGGLRPLGGPSARRARGSHGIRAHMHARRRLVPLHHHPGAVGAENGIRRVPYIPFRVIPDGRHDLLLLPAGFISAQQAEKAALSPAVGKHLPGISAHGGYRRHAREHRGLPVHLGRIKGPSPLGQIAHRPADAFSRQFQANLIPGLQQNALRLHQPLPHGAVGCLPEIPAFRVLQMRPPRDERNFHIRDRRARQHAAVLLFLQMGQYQPLPVSLQRVRRAGGGELQSASPRAGLQQQMHLRIVAQRFIMTRSLHRLRDGFAIQYAALAEAHRQVKPVMHQPPENLQLYLAHQLNMNFPFFPVPDHVQLRVLLLQNAQLLQRRVRIHAHRRQHLIVKHRHQQRRFRVPFGAEPVPCPGLGQPRHRAYTSRLRRFLRLKPGAAVQANLVHLLGPSVPAQHVPGTQRPARNLHPGQPRAGRVMGNLVYAGTEGIPSLRLRHHLTQHVQQSVNPAHFQRAAEQTGKQLAFGHQGAGFPGRNLPGAQIGLHCPLAAHGHLFRRVRPVQIHAAIAQPRLQRVHQHFPVHIRLIHLVHKDHRGHMIGLQQPPQRQRMPLNAVRTADQQHRRVQHPQRPLHLAGKIHMPRRVQQRQVKILPVQPCLF